MFRKSFGFISPTSLCLVSASTANKKSLTYFDLIKGSTPYIHSPSTLQILQQQQNEANNKNISESNSPLNSKTTSLFVAAQQQQQLQRQQAQNSGSTDSSSSASTSLDYAQHAIAMFEEKLAQTKQEMMNNNINSKSSLLKSTLLPTDGENDLSSFRDSICLLLRAFCSTGQVQRARKLFQLFLQETEPETERSAAVFDTWLQLLVQQPTISRTEVAELLKKMEKGSKLKRTGFTYQSLIEAHIRLQLDPSPLFYEMVAKGIPRTPSVLSLLVKGVAPFRSKEAEEARPGFPVEVLREFLKKSKPTDYTVDFLKSRLLAFIASPEISPECALWLLFEIEQRCVVDCASLREIVERVPLVQLLLKCARCGDADTVSSVVAVMERHLVPKSADVLALTLWSQAVAGRVPDAFDTLEDMVRRGYLDHVDHTRRFVIEALGHPMEGHYLTTLADSLNSIEAVDKAYFYLESRHKKGLPVSVHSLDVVVLACGKIGDENRAVETLDAYTSLGVQPRIQSYNALLLSCTGKNKARRHHAVFEAIRRRGIQPNYHTMRILIRQAVLCNNIEEALSYLDQAKNTPGIRIDVEMVLSIFERACKVGDVDTALHVSKVAMECDIGIDAAILRVGCDRLSQLGVDASALQETIGVHEKLRGRHGLGRRN